MDEQRRFVSAAPENSETPLERASSWVTPNRLFFVRNHFAIPKIDVGSWRLRLADGVRRPMEWTYEQLQDLPQHTVFSTMECAGNGRSFLTPRVAGVPWGAGAISHAEWTGVPLRDLLAAAEPLPETKEILFEGADHGTEPDHPEEMHFARSLPLAKAMHPDTLLALRMNGEILDENHGFPIRLIAPGWYGVCSVKWLTLMRAIAEPYRGYFQNQKYTYRRPSNELAVIQKMRAKAEFIRPRDGETLGIGANRLCGVAWAGEETVARVEVSTNAGRSWNDARLTGPQSPYSWVMWEYIWEAGDAKEYSLLCRAVSASGSVQPKVHDPLNGGYMIHFSRPRRVIVERSRRSQDQYADADLLLYDMNAFAAENFQRPLDVELEFVAGEGI